MIACAAFSARDTWSPLFDTLKKLYSKFQKNMDLYYMYLNFDKKYIDLRATEKVKIVGLYSEQCTNCSMFSKSPILMKICIHAVYIHMVLCFRFQDFLKL